PARGLEVPALCGGVHEAAALRGVTEEDTVGQLGAAVRRAGAVRGRGAIHGRRGLLDGGNCYAAPLDGTGFLGCLAPPQRLCERVWWLQSRRPRRRQSCRPLGGRRFVPCGIRSRFAAAHLRETGVTDSPKRLPSRPLPARVDPPTSVVDRLLLQRSERS